MTVSAAKRPKGFARRCRSAREHVKGREAKAAHKFCIVDSNAQEGDGSTNRVKMVNTDLLLLILSDYWLLTVSNDSKRLSASNGRDG
jgi:hypothetical protein